MKCWNSSAVIIHFTLSSFLYTNLILNPNESGMATIWRGDIYCYMSFVQQTNKQPATIRI